MSFQVGEQGPEKNEGFLRAVDCRACRRISLLLLVFGILMFSAPPVLHAFAPDRKDVVEIEYGYPDQSIFVASVNLRGQPESPMTRLAEVLMRRAGIPWHATRYPARRLFNNLRKGTTNFSILVRASSLRNSCIFSREPVYSTSLNLYSIGDKQPVGSRQDLVGKKIITIRGYSYSGLLKFISAPENRIVNEVAGTHRAAFKMLSKKRADYLLDYESAADDILAKRPIKNLRKTHMDKLDIFLVLSKKYPNCEKVMIRLEDIVKTLDVKGILTGRNNFSR